MTIASNPVGQKPGDTASMSQKPMVLILNPASGATMSLDNSPASKGVRVQVQVYDPSHTTIGSVKLSHDGGQTFPDALALNPSYDPVVNQGGAPYYAHVYQADLTTIPAGSWTLQAMVITSGGGAGYSAPIPVSVNAKSVGDGNLLVRNDSNQLCIDCHTLQTHSSQSVSSGSGISKFGSWATSCRDCHTPHKTHNAQLLRESIVPPAYSSYQTAKAVRFWDRITGDSGTVDAISFVSSSAPLASGTLGPCQACHTRTGGAIARWRNTGNSDSHFAGAGTAPCTKCHSHSNGFGGQESLGGQSCGTCHSSKFWNMQASGTPTPALPRLTKHTLGASVQGTNDSFQNPSLSWTSPLSANAPASRSCVGMCHGDHVHNDPAAWPTASHANNLYANAATQASRSLTRDANLGAVTYGFATSASTGSLLAASDFTSGQYTKGCLACHVNQVDTSHPGLSGAAYDASAHNVSVTPTGLPWEYVLHDGSRFVRNCTKCHAGNQAEGQATSYRGSVQGVHYSDNPSLLAGAIRPAGNAASNVCYNCHGNGVIGVNNSNKDVASEVARGGSAHPVNGDTSHDTLAEAALTWGNALGSNSAASRHASCLDCHDPHLAQPSVNDSRVIAGASGNLAAPAIAGVSGARLSGSLAAWTAPAASNFTVVPTISAGSEVEATLCFKCHSSFYWGNDAAKIPTSPSGGFKETDQALEFNPSNRWFHPVLAPTPTPTNNILPPWTTTSRMRCTDCHSSDRTADPGGPHGSAAKYLLKGPNTEWNAGITLANRANYKIFCANCHNVGTFNKSRFSWDFLGTSGNNHTSNHNNSNMRVQCFACHSAIPHGGPRPGGLIAPAGAGAGIPAQTAYDTSPPYSMGTGYRLGLVSYPVTGWDKPNCGCDGLIH